MGPWLTLVGRAEACSPSEDELKFNEVSQHAPAIPFTCARNFLFMDAKDRRIAELETKVAALEAENAALKASDVGKKDKDRIAELEAKNTKLEAEVAALKMSDVQRKPAYMEAVKKTVKGFPFLELAGGSWAIGSKVSKNVYEVDTLYGILMRGEAKIGGGDTAKLLKGKYTPGVPLKGACPIVTDNHLGLHDAALVDWRSAYGTYAAATTIGAIIFAGDAEGFATWAKSKPCRDEVAGVPDGRLFALIDGYLVGVFAQSKEACSTVLNGKGSVVWASGNYYVGEIKGGLMHGEGTFTFADGAKYIGKNAFKDGKFHGKGTYTWPNGNKYVGEMFEDDFHGQGTKTFANGTVQKGRWEHDTFMG